MQSYPQEFLLQPQPLMFVAGLQPAPTKTESAAPDSSKSAAESSLGEAAATDENAAQADVPALVVSTDVTADEGKPGTSDEDGEYEALKESLRKLVSVKGKSRLWQMPGRGDFFRMIMVDKNVKLPSRKVVPSASHLPAGAPPPTPHSPLSPLISTSPLYPDGIISPMWVRKHGDMIPSVFVLFLRLVEFPATASMYSSLANTPNVSAPTSPQGGAAGASGDTADPFASQTSATSSGSKEREIPIPPGQRPPDLERRRKEVEKEADEELIKVIAERRKKLVERGIKFTIVLMTSRDMLDDPALDARLSYIRRHSGLDSRASLFVLTPVPEEDLADFIASLQDALRESAIEYYGGHIKRNRRKRARLSSNPPAIGNSGGLRPLGPQGWAVRYDYKAALFSEMRGETDNARRFLQDAWTELIRMFSSTTTLPPRTKRWAEAKVVADCMAVKYCKLCLYQNDPAATLAFFHQHLGRFGELSRGWGIGEETFEFWSWVARQYRIFAELLEMAIAAGFPLPSSLPAYLPMIPPITLPPGQHPGYYYYTAANCTVQRRDRFAAALEEAEGTAQSAIAASPGFPNEKKVDHAALIIELFTKAYTLFKDDRRAQLRMSLFVAYRIAVTYTEAGQHQMAMKFFERISKNYRREAWEPVTLSIRDLWYDCAQRTGDMETSIRLLLEMMGPGGSAQKPDPSQLQDDLDSILMTTTPSEEGPLELRSETTTTIFYCDITYTKRHGVPSEAVPFIVTLSAAKEAQFQDWTFQIADIYMAGSKDPIATVQGSEDERLKRASATPVNIGAISLLKAAEPVVSEARLTFQPGSSIRLGGTLARGDVGDLQIDKVVLTYRKARWTLQIPCALFVRPSDGIHEPADLGGGIRIESAPPQIHVSIASPASIYTTESARLPISIRNDEDREVSLRLVCAVDDLSPNDVLQLRSGAHAHEGEPALDLLVPAKETTECICVFASSEAGQRTIRASLFDTTRAEDAPPFARASATTNVERPFHVSSSVVYSPIVTSRKPLLSMSIDDGTGAEEIYSAEVFVSLALSGARQITIEKVDFQQSANDALRLVHSTSEQDEQDLPISLAEGDSYGATAIYNIALPDTLQAPPPPVMLVTWTSPDDAGVPQELKLDLPQLLIPVRSEAIDASINVPERVILNEPFPLDLVITNNDHTSAASMISIQIAADDNFVWEGARQIKLPLLLPGGQWVLSMSMTALSETGWQALPSIHIVDGPPESQREIPVRDSRAASAGLGQDVLVLVQPA